MSWTAYDDPEVARKMTGLALGELGRWIAGDHEFHEPWKVFVRFMEHIHNNRHSGQSIRLLDIGCASGYYKTIVREWAHPRSIGVVYQGLERSKSLRTLAWFTFSSGVHASFRDLRDHEQIPFDVVLSGSVLQHEEHWQPFLKDHIAVCARWLIIHKIPIAAAEVEHHTKTAYGVEMDEWHFPVQVINDAVGKAPVMEHYFHSDPPHWSGLYDLSADANL